MLLEWPQFWFYFVLTALCDQLLWMARYGHIARHHPSKQARHTASRYVGMFKGIVFIWCVALGLVTAHIFEASWAATVLDCWVR
jgi:hypothetical protein